MSEHSDMGCGEFADVAAELALGVLTGRERADALAHLDRCDACRETVRQLTLTGEGLLGLLPAIEPPPGFESRVMARIGIEAPGPAHARNTGVRHAWRLGLHWPARRPVRRTLAAVALAVAVVVAGVGGWGLHAATSPAAAPVASSPLSSAALLTASHHSVGQIFYYDAGQRWMYMSVDLESGNGVVRCQLAGQNGRFITVGSFRLDSGYGSWGSQAHGVDGRVTSARLINAKGTVLATARFS
jgi:anti-sigma-K factor RskA